MTRPTRRQIEKRIERLEGDIVNTDPSLVIFTFTTEKHVPTDDEDVPTFRTEPRNVEGIPDGCLEDYTDVLLQEKAALGWGSGIPVLTLEDVKDFRDWLTTALDNLEADTDVAIDERVFIQYLAGRFRGDVPAGEAGVDEQLGEGVTPDHVNRVCRETRHAATRSG